MRIGSAQSSSIVRITHVFGKTIKTITQGETEDDAKYQFSSKKSSNAINDHLKRQLIL